MTRAAVHLDDDIAAALRAYGAVTRRARAVTGLPSRRSDRAAFQITLADGRVVKARRHRRVVTARHYVGLVRLLHDLPLPAILFRQGRVTIEQWVEGRPLSELPRTAARLRAAGEILGVLHGTRRVGRRLVSGTRSPRAFVADLGRRLEELRSMDALRGSATDMIRRMLDQQCPRRARTGITHNDFCAENIVEDPEGRLHVVDNGGLRPGFLDFDLARCQYRWPMPAAAWRTFLESYVGRHRFPVRTEHGPFWRTAALVRSAHYRATRAIPDAAIPLRRLHTLARRG